ncbi:bud-31 [Symbiodinium microadriaticum]|nr:bud-31 [Symbiodinium microadriaticum]
MKQAPEGFDYVEPTLTALENELREKINEPHEGLRKTESQWPVHQINWQRSRYIFDMFYTYNRISREVYDYCIRNKLVDAGLIAKWKKPGYERLCSTYVINTRNYKFGTVSICRVPGHCLAPGTEIEDAVTGCRGCASGPGGNKNIFGNKYGQYLAAIQIARELKQASQGGADDGERYEDSDDEGPVGAADGGSGVAPSVWAMGGEEDEVELPEEVLGVLSADAERESRRVKVSASSSSLGADGDSRSHKKQRKE